MSRYVKTVNFIKNLVSGSKTSPTISSVTLSKNLAKRRADQDSIVAGVDKHLPSSDSKSSKIKKKYTKKASSIHDKYENKKDGGRMGYKSGSKDRDAGGGADSGRRGEAKSRMGVLINKANRRIKNSKLPESPMKEERIFNTKTERLSKIIGKENVGPGYGREVERPTKKAMGGRIGRKMGGGSDMSNTAVKKKHKGFSKLPESIQIKINKKLAKKV